MALSHEGQHDNVVLLRVAGHNLVIVECGSTGRDLLGEIEGGED